MTDRSRGQTEGSVPRLALQLSLNTDRKQKKELLWPYSIRHVLIFSRWLPCNVWKNTFSKQKIWFLGLTAASAGVVRSEMTEVVIDEEKMARHFPCRRSTPSVVTFKWAEKELTNVSRKSLSGSTFNWLSRYNDLKTFKARMIFWKLFYEHSADCTHSHSFSRHVCLK